MKIEIDKKLLKYAVYVTITVISIYIAFIIISNIGAIFGTTFTITNNLLSLIKPLLIAIVIAYLFFPFTKAIEKFLENNKIFKIKKASTRRVLAITFAYFSVIGIFLALLCGIYYMIGGQLSKNTTITNIIEYISKYLSSTSFSTTSINSTIDSLNIPFMDTLKPYIIKAIIWLQNYLTHNIGNMTSYIMSIGSGIASFFVALILSIYLIKDHEYFIGFWNKLYYLVFRESKIGGTITYVFKTVHEVFGKFLRGQLLEAFFVGVLSAVAIAFVGIDYALIIGIIAGISNMIPYVGPLVGTVLAAIVGLLSGTPVKAIYAIIAMQVVQQIDGNLLAPKIVGDSVGLHAVFTIMAILIGGSLGGILGMLLSVPIAASIRVLFNNWYDNYMEKKRLS